MPAEAPGSALASDESELLAGLRAGDGAAFERLVREQGGRMLAVARRYLPDSYRTVLMLRDLEGLDTRDTAKALGISETNVKVRLHRARQALRGLLDPELREQTP